VFIALASSDAFQFATSEADEIMLLLRVDA
jgi:hypothetical protein